jgi:N-acetyl-gamma-glutamyl-phosphate reductase/acetylglutamate kinase
MNLSFAFLPSAELYNRDLTRTSKRISNPGCYATNTQMLLAPLMPYLDPSNMPSVFGISGYSGAGTKTTGEVGPDGLPMTVAKIVSAWHEGV